MTSASDVSELSLLTYLLESGSERIGALDFQTSSSEYVSRTSTSATLEQLMAAAADIETGRVLPPPLAEALMRGTSIGGDRPKVLLAGQRRHLVSALTILGLDEFTGARYGSYALLADHIRQSFTNPAATLRELFSRIVFNILVGNTDDHPRNHAAFVNAAAKICPAGEPGHGHRPEWGTIQSAEHMR